jgi:hypothetical protein
VSVKIYFGGFFSWIFTLKFEVKIVENVKKSNQINQLETFKIFATNLGKNSAKPRNSILKNQIELDKILDIIYQQIKAIFCRGK